MNKIGTIDIAFHSYTDGIYYYDVQVDMQGKKRSIILPRYDVFLGWIEVFGLPPQNEWVVLDELADFSKTATLVVDGVEYEEAVTYAAGENSHHIETVRRRDEHEERCVWTQRYVDAPHAIQNESTFVHAGRRYQASWQTAVLDDVSGLTSAEAAFANEIVAEAGTSDVIIKKTVSAAGELPPLYYTLFPVMDVLDLSKVSGTVIELGYLQTNSPHKVDAVHGDWYKRFVFGDTVLRVVESNYSSRDQLTEAGIKRIKDTYRKELFIE